MDSVDEKWPLGPSINELREAAGKIKRATGAMNSAAAAFNRSPTEGSERWWGKKQADLYVAEDEMFDILIERKRRRRAAK